MNADKKLSKNAAKIPFYVWVIISSVAGFGIYYAIKEVNIRMKYSSYVTDLHTETYFRTGSIHGKSKTLPTKASIPNADAEPLSFERWRHKNEKRMNVSTSTLAVAAGLVCFSVILMLFEFVFQKR